jgi:hypothetical protein
MDERLPLAEECDRAYSERRVVVQGGVESVASSKVDGDLEQIMLQDDESMDKTFSLSCSPVYCSNIPCVNDTGVTQDSLEAVPLLESSHLTTSYTPICTSSLK